MSKPGATSSRPIMRLLDVLGRRWSLRILWELRKGPLTFRALREACDDVSPSSLNQRLADLKGLGIIESGSSSSSGAAGYALTEQGRKLAPTLIQLSKWANANLTS